ncbi:hypothetical protein [Pseudomonas protegens]|uniref:hypothetical protein n=1 Tax=Pseudomonas protegens TaxID=380021 RepID=UPI00383AD8E7
MPYYCQLFTEKIVRYRSQIEVLETRKFGTFQELLEYASEINRAPCPLTCPADTHLTVASSYLASPQNPAVLQGFRIINILSCAPGDARYQLECFRLLEKDRCDEPQSK